MAKKSAVAELSQDIAAKNKENQQLSTEYIETGCVGFDLALTNGNGIPTDAMISMFAPPGVGKTTITADLIYRVLDRTEQEKINFKVLYIDIEGSRGLLQSMGLQRFIDSGTLLLRDTKALKGDISFDKVEELYQKVLKGEEEYKNVKMIVIDSLTGVTSKTLLEASVDKADFGSNAKERERFYRKYVPKLKEKNIINIFICQVRRNQGAANNPYASQTRAATSELDQHWMDFIIKFGKKESASNTGITKVKIVTAEGVQEVTKRYLLGMTTKGDGCKNRFGDMPQLTMLVERGKRIINTFSIRKLLETVKYVSKEGKKWKMHTDLCNLIKHEDYIDKELTEFECNTAIRENILTIKQFLKDQGLYKAIISEETIDDDGM